MEIERSLGEGRSHRYPIQLAAGQFLEIEVEQRGIDLGVSLFDPAGEMLIATDSPNAELGPERVLVLAQETGDHVLEIRPGSPEKAGDYTLRVLTCRDATKRDRTRAAAAEHHWRGDELRKQAGEIGDDARRAALAEYQQAVELWQSASDVSLEALTLHRIGKVYNRLDNKKAALDAFERALGHYRNLELTREEALLQCELGNLHRHSGRYQEALKAFHRARELFEHLADRYRVASMLNNIALVYDAMGQRQEALGFYDQALAKWRELKRPEHEAVTLNNIAEVYISLAQLQAARDHLEKTLELRRLADDRGGETRTLNTRGTVFRRLGQLEQARADFERSLAIHRELDDSEGMIVTLIGLGLTCVKQKGYGRAREAYTKALEIARNRHSRKNEGFALVNLGWLDEAEGRSEHALEHFDKAFSIFEELDERTGEVSALFGLAKIKRSTGDLEGALSCVEEALDRLESLRRETYSETLGASVLARRHHYFEFHIDLLMQIAELKPEADYDVRALTASERSRAQSLLDTLIEAKVELRRGVPPELIERQAALQEQLNAKDRERPKALNRGLTASQAEAVDRELTLLTMEYREAEAQIRMASPAYAALTRPQPPQLAEIQHRILDDETLLLEYALGEKRSFLWLVGRDSFSTYELPGREKIERLALGTHRLLAGSWGKTGEHSLDLKLTALSEILLEPVADRLEDKRLLIIGAGALQYLPFAALYLPRTSETEPPRPLVADHEIVTLPSVSVVQLLRDRHTARSEPSREVIVLADPVFQSDDPRVERSSDDPPDSASAMPGSSADPGGYQRLLSSKEEAEAILGMVAPGEGIGKLGFDASLDLVMSGELAKYRIVHFATHAEIETGHPELSAIVLSRVDRQGSSVPGSLRLYQIYELDLPAELVVLSACKTALGAQVRGEGLMSLTRGFMYAGTRRVIVSLWSVGDRSTAELMKRLYRAMLEQKQPPSAALRQAQLSMRREERWRSPYYWAGFVLQGDWR
ncbi:MAG: CHAT domain-containing protein [bacterium]|nr:CHAT domain-containing protein [bacterium]